MDPNVTGFGSLRKYNTVGLWGMCAKYHLILTMFKTFYLMD